MYHFTKHIISIHREVIASASAPAGALTTSINSQTTSFSMKAAFLCNDKKSSLNRDKPDTVNERARNPTPAANNQHAAYIMIHFFHL
jgi:hypothetical protein